MWKEGLWIMSWIYWCCEPLEIQLGTRISCCLEARKHRTPTWHSKMILLKCDSHILKTMLSHVIPISSWATTCVCVCVSFLYACPWLRKARKRTHNVDWCVKGWLAWKRTVMANTRICTSDWGLRLQMWNHVIIHVVYTVVFHVVFQYMYCYKVRIWCHMCSPVDVSHFQVSKIPDGTRSGWCLMHWECNI